MQLITRSCVLFLWLQTLTLVKSQNCTLQDFLKGPLFDSNFDTTSLEATYTGGRQVRVTCNVGFSGFFKLICADGQWTSRGTKCQPKSCGHPGDAQFADFQLQQGQDFVFGSEVVYTCHKGYQMVSRNNVRRCMAEGWDGVVPVCEAQQCSVVNVEDNVVVIGDPQDSNYGNVLRFNCRFNTEVLDGAQEIYCDENGEWSAKPPACKEIKCPAREIANGYITGDMRDYKEGEILHFECDRRYKKQSGIPSKCLKLGTSADFNPAPVCTEIRCRDELGPHVSSFGPPGRLGDNLRIYRMDDAAEYKCESGFRPTSSQATATCTRNGWSPDPLCEGLPCDKKEVLNAKITINDKQTYANGEWVRYVCMKGYTGQFMLTCKKGNWTGNPVCAEAGCSRINIGGARITYNNKRSYNPGEQVQYTCTDDPQQQTFTVTCSKGNWDGIQNCEGCSKLTIAHGFVVARGDKKAYYTCNKDYKLSTKGWWNEAKCENRQWTGHQKCIEKSQCGELPEIPNGKLTRQETSTRAAIQIRCEDGYSTQIQQNGLTCRDGAWDFSEWSPERLCMPNWTPCSPPPRVMYAVIESPYQEKYLSGSELTYQCADGYTMEGDSRIRCVNGQWEQERNTICTPPAAAAPPDNRDQQ